MAVVDDRREVCEGCNSVVPLESLEAVTMPDGSQIACCPDCAPLARVAAAKQDSLDHRRTSCEGCTTAVPEADLTEVALPDGVVLSCCPACLEEVDGLEIEGVVDQRSNDRTTSGRGSSAAQAAKESGTSSRGGATDQRRARGTESTLRDSGSTRCTQCREQVSVELYEVETVDGRTERLCPDCKALAEERRVVKAVRMRRTEARAILDVGPDADHEELKAAYRAQVKRAHPDRETGSRTAFALVNEAYDRLT